MWQCSTQVGNQELTAKCMWAHFGTLRKYPAKCPDHEVSSLYRGEIIQVSISYNGIPYSLVYYCFYLCSRLIFILFYDCTSK